MAALEGVSWSSNNVTVLKVHCSVFVSMARNIKLLMATYIYCYIIYVRQRKNVRYEAIWKAISGHFDYSYLE